MRPELRNQAEAGLAVKSEPMVSKQSAEAALQSVEPEVEVDPKSDNEPANAEVSEPEPESMRELRKVASIVPEPAKQEVPAFDQMQPQQSAPIARQNAGLAYEPRAVARKFSRNAQQLILVTSTEMQRLDKAVAAELQDLLASQGASTVLINAGGPDRGQLQGLTDMVDGEADFGSIINMGSGEDQYVVRWGTKTRLNFRSERFSLMIEALCEIYDHVIVECGQFGMRAPLPPFADKGAALLLAGTGLNADQIEFMRDDARAIGIDNVLFVSPNEQESNVA